MSFAFFLESLIVSPNRAEKVKHQRSHFWTWCRIFGRLRIPALGRVFNANLTSCPEHAIIYSEVINLTFKVNSRKTFADISVICFQVFPDKKDNSPQFSFPSDFINEFVFSLPF